MVTPIRLLVLSSALMISTLTTTCSEQKDVTLNPSPPEEVNRDFKVIHTYVALCDNKSQGIAPVPTKIGNGDDPANNLYWGCSDGARAYFSKSKKWTRLQSTKVEGNANILERLVFQHKSSRTIMIVDAWRGSTIKDCMTEFCSSLAGQKYHSITLEDSKGKHTINIAGGADLLAFIGHNGLMEFSLPANTANPHRKQKVDAIALCCQSDRFFQKHIQPSGANPILMTKSNMYPGAFLLHDAIEGWLLKEKPEQIRNRAAKAYGKNQKISTKSALTVFAPLP